MNGELHAPATLVPDKEPVILLELAADWKSSSVYRRFWSREHCVGPLGDLFVGRSSCKLVTVPTGHDGSDEFKA